MVESDLISLKGVRSALVSYQGKIAGTSVQVASQFGKDINECQNMLNKERKRLDGLKDKLADITKKHQKAIDVCKRKESKLEEAQNDMAAKKRALNVARLRLNDDPEEQKKIDSENNRLEFELIESHKKCQQLDEEIRSLIKEEEELKCHKAEVAKAVSDCENRVKNMESKLNELNRYGEALIVATRELELDALDTSKRGTTCINSCITYLNQYLEI